MADILRIQDRFSITGRGLAYTVKYNKGAIIRIGDLFYDLQGHRSKVKELEMLRRCFPDVPLDGLSIGIMFELLDGVEVTGNILVSELSDINFLFCKLAWIDEIASKVRSNFVTVDLARKEDGTLIIMELGDGQVSGLQEIDEKNLYGCFLEKEGE